MKLISLYTFIFIFTLTNQSRLLEGSSSKNSKRSRSADPKKGSSNLQNVFGAIQMPGDIQRTNNQRKNQQKQNVMGLKNQLKENEQNGQKVTKYIEKSQKLQSLQTQDLNLSENMLNKKHNERKRDKDAQEVQEVLKNLSSKDKKKSQNPQQAQNVEQVKEEKKEGTFRKIANKLGGFFKKRNLNIEEDDFNEKKRNILDNKKLEINDEFGTAPVHKRIFEIKNKDNNKQDIEKNTDPIEIVYEMGRVKADIKDKNKYKEVEELLEKADSILKKYIRIQKGEEKKIVFPKEGFKKFKTNYKNDLIYNGHLVVLVKVIQIDNGVLAQSNVLQQTIDHRATIGYLEINTTAMTSSQYNSDFEIQRFILTLVHEIIHILAFNTKKSNPLEAGISKPLQNLSAIAEAQNPSIYDNAHWNEAYIPNDIMTPISRKNQILTIYTLEMMEEYSTKYQTLPKYLPNNFLFDSIENKKQFFEYKCKNDEAKYPSFCTKKDLQTDNWGGCTGDYLFKTYCKEAELGNNCNLNIPTQDGNCMDPQSQSVEGFEVYSPESRCMVTDSGSSLCAKFRLEEQIINNKSDIRLFFTIRGKEKECTQDGEIHQIGKIRVGGRKKEINVVCPQISKFITYFKKTNCPNQCNQNGFCSDGQCICFDGFDPRDNCKSRINKNQDKTVFTKYLVESN